MRRRNPLIVTAAAASMFLAGIVPAAAAGSDDVDQYHQLQASGIMTLTPDGRTHVGPINGTELVVNAVGDIIDRLPFTAKPLVHPFAADSSSTTCVRDTDREGFTAYLPPAEYPISKRNEKGFFKFHLYSQDGARHDRFNQPTVQFVMCGVGGVDAANGSRITISGPGMAYNDAQGSNILGHSWKEGKTPEDYSISLGFEVPVRGVTIKGSIQQNPGNYLKGSVVPPYAWGDMADFHRNAVNAWWEDGCRPRCTRFGGSNGYQGSVGEGLWEFPQTDKDAVLARGFKFAGYLEHFCANPFGC